MKKATDYSKNSLLFEKAEKGDQKAKESIILNNLPLVKSIAIRFTGRGYELEDLIETGTLGLIKAVNGFDTSLGYSFSTYAFSVITGEIKRFLRDDGIIKVSRITKKNAATVMKARQDFLEHYGREPKVSELCESCGLSSSEISEALISSMPVMSIFENKGDTDSSFTVLDFKSDDDTIDKITERLALSQAIGTLEGFDRKLICMRYLCDMTQAETAKALGTTQVTISRAEKRILQKLKEHLICQ